MGWGKRPFSNVPVLFVLRGANMAITTDQVMTKLFQGSAYVVTNIIAVWKSGAFNTACIGGCYSASAKGGDAILAATQTYNNLTGAGTVQTATLANLLQTKSETATPTFALTTANGAALTADILILGVCVD